MSFLLCAANVSDYNCQAAENVGKFLSCLRLNSTPPFNWRCLKLSATVNADKQEYCDNTMPKDNWERELLLPFLQHVQQSGNNLYHLLYVSGRLHFVPAVQLVSVDWLSQQTEYFNKQLSPVDLCNRKAMRFTW